MKFRGATILALPMLGFWAHLRGFRRWRMHRLPLNSTTLQMRAQHCRLVAKAMHDQSVRERFILMAAEYEWLAEEEERTRRLEPIHVDDLE
jgi:hypothetical protein